MMPAASILTPISGSDEPFLVELYASTRAEEMSLVSWSDERKQAFLRMQFEAQDRYYRERYPNASFNLIKINDRPVGRFYVTELDDEIRIIDLVFLPFHFDSGFFARLLEEVLQKGARAEKPVRIYLESFNPQTEIFVQAGFRKIGENGFYFLWEHDSPAAAIPDAAAADAEK